MKGSFDLFDRSENTAPERAFFLTCDFGYDITSPIPSVQESHHNDHGVVPAVPGTTVSLFPDGDKRQAEFGAFILDDKGEPCGIECIILRYPRRLQEKFEEMGIPCVMFGVSLMLDQKEYFETSDYQDGKRTHMYYSLILQEKATRRAAL